ncbi:hypothetical protein [Streptomyces azureus]|uniref:Secreted protein n=1 Tax=Streptomyces azureus TaxID=146537 RepID=A0A0K8PFE7_STRAJ|nr:hypothetical protein [Streptomyces azureus]GAP46610.1 uncharacterized protein SAZU_1348 [Streptomyces azureus]
MNKFQKATAVAVMVGGMALSGGVAHACDKDKSDDKPSGVAIDNLQVVECDQDFNGGLAFAPVQIAVLGDNTQAIGNFCTVVGPVED